MNALIRTGNYIDGQWSHGGPTYPVLNPANGELIAEVQRAGVEDTNLAIDAANRALPAWRKLTAKERSQRLKRWSELMLGNQKDLAHLLSLEQGKPLAEAMGEVVYAASFLEWFAEEAKRAYGDVIPNSQSRCTHPCDQGSHWRGCRDHPVELPAGDGHAQGCPGTGGRLHDDSQTFGRHSIVGVCPGGAGRTGRYSCRCLQYRLR